MRGDATVTLAQEVRTLVSPSMEDYVGKIWRLTQNGRSATTSDVARKLGVTPASVSSMFRKLAEAGLVEYKEYAGVTLTEAGKAAAMKSVRRHRVLERFFVDVLNIPWEDVDAIADPAEHVLPEIVVDRMEAMLTDASTCPHGYPIPTRDGKIREMPVRSVSEMDAGETGVIARVAEYEPDLLRYMARHRLVLGQTIKVLRRDAIGATLTLEVGGQTLVVGLPVAEQVWVRA